MRYRRRFIYLVLLLVGCVWESQCQVFQRFLHTLIPPIWLSLAWTLRHCQLEVRCSRCGEWSLIILEIRYIPERNSPAHRISFPARYFIQPASDLENSGVKTGIPIRHQQCFGPWEHISSPQKYITRLGPKLRFADITTFPSKIYRICSALKN